MVLGYMAVPSIYCKYCRNVLWVTSIARKWVNQPGYSVAPVQCNKSSLSSANHTQTCEPAIRKCSISQFIVRSALICHHVYYCTCLHTACWQNEYSKRPTFSEILKQLRNIEREEFMTSTSFDDFASIQSTWKSEIQEQFLKFKREESVSQF